MRYNGIALIIRKERTVKKRSESMMVNETFPAKQPLVSVIVPMHQAAPYLNACLDSIAAQTYRKLEILMIDSDSTDATGAIAGEYAARDSRFHFLHCEGTGVSAARNKGLEAATGEWIGFCDSDDVMLPDAVNTLLSAALTNGTAMSMGAYVECHPGKHLSFNRKVSAPAGVFHTPEETQRYFLTKGKFLCHMWTKLFRRDVFDGICFPEGKIYEDNFILPHLFEAAGSCAVVNKPVYHYMVRPGSLSTSRNVRRQLDGLEARQTYADLMKECHPELVPLANDMTLTFCCDLMGKMEHIGIDKMTEEWTLTTETARRLLPEAALQNVGFKLGAAAFRKNPRIVSKFVRWLLRVDRMI